MKIVKYIILSLFILCSHVVSADEGMWLLSLLSKQNSMEMKRLGLKIDTKEIVGNEKAVSNAVVSFDGGCTASFISGKGLLLTNYHCSYNAIQKNSSIEHNYIKDGFWAENRTQEIPINGLTILVTKKIEDVSDAVSKRIKAWDKTTPWNKFYNSIVDEYRKKYNGYKVNLRSYRKNTIHVLYVQESFSDVRMVCAPPQSVAKFGGETDNWQWPRHNCDFAMFRLYANKENRAAAYSKNNIPYVPERHLKISMEGYKENDFAMAIGFPGFTDRQASSMKISEVVNALNPPMIYCRALRQEILADEIAKSEENQIKYSAKYSTSANYYKNSVGINEWVKKLNIIEKKQKYEQENILPSIEDESERALFQSDLNTLATTMKECEPYKAAIQYYIEGLGESCEMLRFVSSFGGWLKSATDEKAEPENRKNFIDNLNIYYKNYSEEVDRRVTKNILKLLRDSLDKKFLPDFYQEIETKFNGDIDRFTDDLFNRSLFANIDKINKWMKNPVVSYEDDPAVRIINQIDAKRGEVSKKVNELENSIKKQQSAYYNYGESSITGAYYPNADRTIRITYGQIVPLTTPEGVKHSYQTTLDGVIKKESPTNRDFFLPQKMKDLCNKKDFGGYVVDGDVPVSFIVNADVTGGNSGSPMMNAKGELIGLLYDCNWESMTRDYNFDKDLHRAICLDVRYLLFVVEKYGNSKHLIDEILGSK